MPIFSKRTNWPLAPNPLVERYQEIKKQNKDFIDLTLSNLTNCGLTSLNDELLKGFNHPDALRYEPLAQGAFKTRQVISDYYQRRGIKVDPTQIFLTSSTSEGYSYLFRLLANPQEALLFPQPSYPLFQYLIDLNDLKMDYYPLVYTDAWEIDHDVLDESIDLPTKAVVVVNPNNPTGSYIKEDEYQQLVTRCRKHDLSIISDEVFWDYPLEAEGKQISFAAKNDVLTFTLSGISKVLGLPQMKLSWIVVSGPKETRAQAIERLDVIADTYLSVSTPIQIEAQSWFQVEGKIQDEVKGRLTANLALLRKELVLSNEVECLKVEGGWYAILKLPIKFSDEEWTTLFLEKDHVFVHPGYFYDFIDDSHIVISLLPAPDIFAEAVNRLLKRISIS